jgi:hypothetical protein
MSKIQMKTPLVEMDGDEMTRILWRMIKDELLLPFIDLKPNITISVYPNVRKQRIKSLLIRLMLRKNMALPLSVQPSPPTSNA